VQHFIVLSILFAACGTVEVPCTTEDPLQARKELEKAYAQNGAAFFARDADAVMRLRHPDFHTVDHTGALSTRQQMYDRTRLLVQRVERFERISEEILSLELHGDTAIAVVRQETSRFQLRSDEKVHRLDTKVTQREWWRCTSEGWRMWRVDDIRDRESLVDGKPTP
jgi:hypothetical protein